MLSQQPREGGREGRREGGREGGREGVGNRERGREGEVLSMVKVTGVLFLINIHEILLLPFSACTHCEPKQTKSSKKQLQLHVIAALVSTLAHTVREWKAGLNFINFDVSFYLQRMRCVGFINIYGEFRTFSTSKSIYKLASAIYGLKIFTTVLIVRVLVCVVRGKEGGNSKLSCESEFYIKRKKRVAVGFEPGTAWLESQPCTTAREQDSNSEPKQQADLCL